MKSNQLWIGLTYVGTFTTALANIEANTGMIQAIAVLISSIGGLAYAVAMVCHVVQHLKTGAPIDDPEKPRAVRDFDRDIPAATSERVHNNEARIQNH